MSKLAHIDQQAHLREQLEVESKHWLIRTIGTDPIPRVIPPVRPPLQVWTCVDDRTEGLRRYIEESDSKIETFGVPGFFGVPVKYRPIDGREIMTLAPVGNAPDFTLVEEAHPDDRRAMEAWKSRRHAVARVSQLSETMSFLPGASLLSVFCLAPISIARLLLMPFPNVLARAGEQSEQ